MRRCGRKNKNNVFHSTLYTYRSLTVTTTTRTKSRICILYKVRDTKTHPKAPPPPGIVLWRIFGPAENSKEILRIIAARSSSYPPRARCAPRRRRVTKLFLVLFVSICFFFLFFLSASMTMIAVCLIQQVARHLFSCPCPCRLRRHRNFFSKFSSSQNITSPAPAAAAARRELPRQLFKKA